MPYDVDIGDGADALGQNQLTDALDGTYWVSGWDATLGTGDLEVDIAAGSGAVDGTDVSTGSTQTIDFTGDPDSTDPRKAVIYVDSGGTVQKALGTPQPVDPSGEIRFRTYNPSPPASVSGVVVAEVWLPAGETVLEGADIRDRRVSNDAVEAVQPDPNVPNWKEDANSPIVLNNSGSSTTTLDGSYSTVRLLFFPEPTAVGNPVDMRINGITDYDTVDNGNTQTTGDTTVPLSDSDSTIPGTDVIISKSNSTSVTLTGTITPAGASTGQITGFETTSGSTIDDIRIYNLSVDDLAVRAKIYGIPE